MKKHTKGQVSFESLIILLLVMTAAVSITTLYMQTHETTIAMATIRSEITKQSNEKNYEIIIEKIIINKGTDTNIIVQIVNSGNTTINFDETPIITQVENMTSFRNITLKINSR